MPKADRLAERLPALEEEYRSKLVSALQQCAAGRWGLFGHNERLTSGAPVDPMVEALSDLGHEIDHARDRLDLEPFALHARFLASRGPASPNAVGEPKQAQAWLEELHEPLTPRS
jgi:hypothetical protein